MTSGSKYQIVFELNSGTVEKNGTIYSAGQELDYSILQINLMKSNASSMMDYLLRADIGSTDETVITVTESLGLNAWIFSGITFNNATFVVYLKDADSLPYSMSEEVSNTKIFGWLPYDTKRNNLHQIMFANNISLLKDDNGDMFFEYISDEIVFKESQITVQSVLGTWGHEDFERVVTNSANTIYIQWNDVESSSGTIPLNKIRLAFYHDTTELKVVWITINHVALPIPTNTNKLIIGIYTNNAVAYNTSITYYNLSIVTNSFSIDDDRLYINGTIEYPTIPSEIQLTEHSYQFDNNIDPINVIDNTSTTGDQNGFYIFDNAPIVVSTLTPSEGVTILSANENYAVIEGVGIVTGIPYYDKTNIITRNFDNNGEPYSVSVTDATLVTIMNSGYVADRLLSYYTSARIVKGDVKLLNEKTGGRYTFTDAFGDLTIGYLEKMTLYPSSFIKAACEFVVGYSSSSFGNAYEYQIALEQPGTLTVPYGTRRMLVTMIGGGNGGSSGYAAEDPEIDWENDPFSCYRNQTAGKGGSAGEPGAGGKIYQVLIANPPAGDWNCILGLGGIGGEENSSYEENNVGTSGEDTILVSPTGTVYSTANSSAYRSEYGIMDQFTGVVYGRKGHDGAKGGNGGRGNTNGSGENGEDIEFAGETFYGGEGGDGYNFVFKRVDRSAFAGGAGGSGAQAFSDGLDGGNARITLYADLTQQYISQGYDYKAAEQVGLVGGIPETVEPVYGYFAHSSGDGGDAGHGGAGRGGYGGADSFTDSYTDTNEQQVVLWCGTTGGGYIAAFSSPGLAAGDGRQGAMFIYSDKPLSYTVKYLLSPSITNISSQLLFQRASLAVSTSKSTWTYQSFSFSPSNTVSRISLSWDSVTTDSGTVPTNKIKLIFKNESTEISNYWVTVTPTNVLIPSNTTTVEMQIFTNNGSADNTRITYTNLTVYATANNAIIFTIRNRNSNDTIEIQRRYITDNKWLSLGRVTYETANTDHSYTDETASGGRSFEYRAISLGLGTAVDSDYSNSIITGYGGTKLNTPSPIATGTVYGIHLSWNAVSNATSYVIAAKPNGNYDWTYTVTDQLYSDLFIDGGEQFSFKVLANREDGTYVASDWSNVVSASAPATGQVITPVITSGNYTEAGGYYVGTGILIKWDASYGSCADYYRIERKLHTDSAWEYVANYSDPYSGSYFDQFTVQSRQQWDYRIMGFRDGWLSSEYSEVYTVTVDRRLPAPTFVSVTDAGLDTVSLTVSVDNIDGRARYLVWEVSVNGGAWVTELTTQIGSGSISPSPSFSSTLTGSHIVFGGFIKVRCYVRASGYSNSDPSNELSITVNEREYFFISDTTQSEDPSGKTGGWTTFACKWNNNDNYQAAPTVSQSSSGGTRSVTVSANDGTGIYKTVNEIDLSQYSKVCLVGEVRKPASTARAAFGAWANDYGGLGFSSVTANAYYLALQNGAAYGTLENPSISNPSYSASLGFAVTGVAEYSTYGECYMTALFGIKK